MPQKKRDYTNLKETAKVYEAVDNTITHVKDYSMKHVITVTWKPHSRLVTLTIGDQSWSGMGKHLLEMVNSLVEDTDDDDHMWVAKLWVEDFNTGRELEISTAGVNKECLRDHVATVTIGKNEAIIDLEELLKATRYA